MSVQKWSDQIWIAQTSADPVFSEDIEFLQQKAAGTSMAPHMVIDLSGVSHLNSSNLSQLLRLRKRIIDTDAQLRLTGPQDPVWAVFISTALDRVFQFQPDTSTALAELQLRDS